MQNPNTMSLLPVTAPTPTPANVINIPFAGGTYQVKAKAHSSLGDAMQHVNALNGTTGDCGCGGDCCGKPE